METIAAPVEKVRIDWIDIAKGILIILVVVGHITGIFNRYIYQFHMGAFFILSGFTSGGKKKTFGRIAWYRFVPILLPLVIFLLLGSILNTILMNNGVYETAFDMPFMTIGGTFKNFLQRGDIYVQFLGACWFLLAIVGISLLNKFILIICRNSANIIYLLISFGLFCLAYLMMNKSYDPRILIFNVLMILLGNWFYSIGYYLKEHKVFEINMKWWIRLIIIAVCAGIMLLYRFFSNGTVDYPAHSFNNPFRDTLLPINGLVLTVFISYFIEKAPKPVWIWLSQLGKKSLGIVLLHFLFMKLFDIICASTGYIGWETIAAVVPSARISQNLWYLDALFTLGLSYGLWWCLSEIPFVRILFGQDKKITGKSCEFLANFIFFTWIGKGLEFLKNKYFQFLDWVKHLFVKKA